MWDYYLSGFLLRSVQIVVDSAIWIGFGFFIAAVLRRMIGPEKVCQLFGSGRWYGIFIGWAVGMLLPVCSLGAIPVIRELYRSGVRGGAIIAFGLTAPLFNPLSVLYGLTLSDPIAIIIFSFGALVIVTLLGLVWDRLQQPEQVEVQDELPVGGVKRSVALLCSAGKDFTGISMLYILLGILASATLATLTPHGSLQTQAEPDKIFAPVFMAVFVTPIYATPLQAMSQIGSMFQHGNSIGAAFSLLILGAGTNLGLLAAFSGQMGLKKTLLFLGMLMLVTISLAYAVDKPLYPKGVSPSGHTHAFDVYTHPYPKQDVEFMVLARGAIKEYRASRDFGGTYFLAALLLIGVVFRIVSCFVDVESWFQAKGNKVSGLEVAVPPWIIGVVTCIGLVSLSVVGAYMYYPPVDDLMDDLFMVNTNCVLAGKTGDWDGVSKWVGYCDDLSRRLEVSLFLRKGGATEFQKAKAKVYRDSLDELRDAIEAGFTQDAKELSQQVSRSYMQLSEAFREKKKY